MILTRQEMLEVERCAFARGVSADVLMESVGAKLARFVTQFFPQPGLLLIYAGKGHNAGDAFVAARHLQTHGWRVLVRSPWGRDNFAPLTRDKFDLLHPSILSHALHPSTPQDGPLVQLDALVGLGSTGELREPLTALAGEMNMLRREANAQTIAVDLPSGLDIDNGYSGEPCVIADFTATVGYAKAGLVADAAINHVGRLGILEVAEFSGASGSDAELLTASALRQKWPPRVFDTNKGMCGRIMLLAGSRGTLGAAHFCTSGAVRGGGGLVSLGALPEAYDLLAPMIIPEVMVRPLDKFTDALRLPLDALGIGPGLGHEHAARTLRVVREATCPAVVDADALTIVAHAGLQHLDRAKGPRLLTPHPGEMTRLLAGRKIDDRARVARNFSDQHNVTLLLKGARTVIATKGRALAYNTTGTPGMATGGMGDVLTGVCTALLGQGADPHLAASIGAWVCGRAAELAITHGHASPESLTPTCVLEHLGAAFSSLRRGDF
jgi:NAD(P)H-hydrate epimerase